MQVANAKVLAVGAGGIGCELLKTLVMTGFKNIEVVRLPRRPSAAALPPVAALHLLAGRLCAGSSSGLP